LKIAHLSFASDSRDAGIATSLSDLIHAQQSIGLCPSWQVVSELPFFNRDTILRDFVLSGSDDLAHLHGLWRAPTRIATSLASNSIPLVISPHGMLSKRALSISSLKKQLVWRLWEHRALTSARCLHALSSSEATDIRNLDLGIPIAVIPNCVRIPDLAPNNSLCPPPWASSIPDSDSVLLFLGRFHSIKGLMPLLSAWKSVESFAKKHSFWLVLVGYGDNGALARHVSLSHKAGDLTRVRVFGPVFGSKKDSTFAFASGFILPSFSEALPMSALEAMAHKKPVLLSSACNLPQAFSVGAAMPAEPEPSALAASLKSFFELTSNDRLLMGNLGHSLVSNHFSGFEVASQTRELYNWILGGGSPPPFVELG